MAEPQENNPRINGVPLREYVEALFEQESRRSEREADEREKAAQALRGEQTRAMEQAEREREKAANALRIGLERAMQEGDDRLREHISNQVQQITAALTSADKLEIQRVSAAETRTQSVQRELAIVHAASEKAISKAEEAITARLDLLNEFRSQMSDESAKYALKDVVDSRLGEIALRSQEQVEAARTLLTDYKGQVSGRFDQIDARLNQQIGERSGNDRLYGYAGIALGLVIAAIVAANAIFGA